MPDVVWWCALLTPCSYFRERRLQRERQPYDYERDYLASFPKGPYRQEIARFAWDMLQRYVCVKNFPIYAHDSMRRLYKIDNEEIMDILYDVMKDVLNLDPDNFDFSHYDIRLVDSPVAIYKFCLDALEAKERSRLSNGKPIVVCNVRTALRHPENAR